MKYIIEITEEQVQAVVEASKHIEELAHRVDMYADEERAGVEGELAETYINLVFKAIAAANTPAV